MANVLVDESALQDIADSIREKNGTQDTYKPAQMPQAILNIETGGGDSFYDAFWNGYQQNGTRIDYRNAFSGANNWTADSFRPKYDIGVDVSISTHYMFQNSTMAIDLEQHLKECGIELNLTQVTVGNCIFQNSRFTVIPAVFIEGSASTSVFSNNPNLHTIRKVTIRDRDTIANHFAQLPALVNIVLDGEIGKNLSFAQSPLLSDASVQSIIDHLADLTDQASQTLTFHADVKAKLTDTQIATITSKNWTLA